MTREGETGAIHPAGFLSETAFAEGAKAADQLSPARERMHAMGDKTSARACAQGGVSARHESIVEPSDALSSREIVIR